MGRLLIACAATAFASGAHAQTAQVTTLFTHDLPSLAGKEGMMLTVAYPPGGADPIHRHDASVFVYVLQGTVIMQIEGAEPITLHPGETFYEGPTDVHLVGRNASQSEPAKFLAFLVKDKGTPAVRPAR